MKLVTILTVGLLSAACYASPNYMKNGYQYERWGNNFISVTANGETRQAIEGQVERYSVNENSLIAKQEDFDGELIAYWIINMETHKKTRYSDSQSFSNTALSLGFDKAKIQEITGS